MTKRRSQGTRALLEEMGDLGGLAEVCDGDHRQRA